MARAITPTPTPTPTTVDGVILHAFADIITAATFTTVPATIPPGLGDYDEAAKDAMREADQAAHAAWKDAMDHAARAAKDGDGPGAAAFLELAVATEAAYKRTGAPDTLRVIAGLRTIARKHGIDRDGGDIDAVDAILNDLFVAGVTGG
jgi:hypothetical protein